MAGGLRPALLVALLLGGCSQAPSGFEVDLGRCEIEGLPFDTVLRWTTESLDPASARYRRVEPLFRSGPAHGVYLGMCSVDPRHGRAMVIRLDGAEDSLPRLHPKLTPLMPQREVERLFGPAEGYRPLLLSGQARGTLGTWQGPCSGYTMELRFDAEARLTSLTVYPASPVE